MHDESAKGRNRPHIVGPSDCGYGQSAPANANNDVPIQEAADSSEQEIRFRRSDDCQTSAPRDWRRVRAALVRMIEEGTGFREFLYSASQKQRNPE
jgi:hypothetical protein